MSWLRFVPTLILAAGVESATLDALRGAPPADPRWGSILAVHLADADGSVPAGRPALAGAYRVEGAALRFTPRFPLAPTRPYRAILDPDGPAGPLPPAAFARPAAPEPPARPTVVSRIEPAADCLPANLLRFSIHFDAPMGRGAAYDHLTLLDAAGKPLDHPFLELGEELWDPTGTRLTVLLDPGRIKRGLVPRQELGPILHPGRTYALRVDPAWRDAAGHPLAAAASKTFATVAEDDASPSPKSWAITPPRAGSTDPLVVRFGDILDRATVATNLTLLDPSGVELPGTALADLDGTGWRLTPDRPWAAGTYHLAINPDLEDLAGNSVRRPFEVDVQRDVPATAPAVDLVRLPVRVAP